MALLGTDRFRLKQNGTRGETADDKITVALEHSKVRIVRRDELLERRQVRLRTRELITTRNSAALEGRRGRPVRIDRSDREVLR